METRTNNWEQFVVLLWGMFFIYDHWMTFMISIQNDSETGLLSQKLPNDDGLLWYELKREPTITLF